MLSVAALFVRSDGPYANRPDVDLWDIARDARLYAGPHPVVAHPPCARWGQLWWTAKHLGKGKGDDDGCFASALKSLRAFGGVIEHPEASYAFSHFHLGTPQRGGWTQADPMFRPNEWICSVDQGRYGHMARKRTWLVYVGDQPPFDLDWRDGSTGCWVASGPGGRSAEELRIKGITLMPDTAAGKDAKDKTPPEFADALLGLARRSRGGAYRRRDHVEGTARTDSRGFRGDAAALGSGE